MYFSSNFDKAMPDIVRVPQSGTLLPASSRFPSRWTPLLSANGWQLPTLIVGLAPPSYYSCTAHRKKARFLGAGAFLLYWIVEKLKQKLKVILFLIDEKH